MGDVAAGPATPVELVQAAQHKTNTAEQGAPGKPFGSTRCGDQHGKNVGNRALFDNQTAVDIGLTELELGIEQRAILGRVGRKADGARDTTSIAQYEGGPARGRDQKISLGDELP